MFCRAFASAVPALCLAVVLFPATPCNTSAARAEADDQSLRFDEVETLARSRSPRIRMIEQRVEAANAELEAATAWSNPALAYDHEEADSFREWQVTLAKRFEAPLSQSGLRASREARAQAVLLQAEFEIRTVVAELKAGYVKFQLFGEYLERMDQLSELLRLASGKAEERHAEGELSGVDRNLIQIAVYAVEASGRNARQEYLLEFAAWRAEAGLGPLGEVTLATAVGFAPVALDHESDYLAMLADQPLTRAREAHAESLRKASAATLPSFVPALELYGGYRRFDPGLDGFVAGIAMDLPFFDRSAATSRVMGAESVIVEYELDLSRDQAYAEIAALIQVIATGQVALEEFTPRVEQSGEFAETLLLAWREGSLALDALLSAIQIEMAALRNYYDEVAAWYLSLFRLEAMTGASIVDLRS
jgi:hypothetical protein